MGEVGYDNTIGNILPGEEASILPDFTKSIYPGRFAVSNMVVPAQIVYQLGPQQSFFIPWLNDLSPSMENHS